jgi:hypothetical protein
MSQSRTISLIESVLNMVTGAVISVIVWMVAGPMFGYTVGLVDASGFTLMFTAVSIVRSYIWRRLFVKYLDRWLHKVLHNEVR